MSDDDFNDLQTTAWEDALRTYGVSSAASYIARPVTLAVVFDLARTLGNNGLEIAELPAEPYGEADV